MIGPDHEAVLVPERAGWIRRWYVRPPGGTGESDCQLEQRPWLRFEGNQRLRVNLGDMHLPGYTVAALLVLDDGSRYVVGFVQLAAPPKPPEPRPRLRVIFDKSKS